MSVFTTATDDVAGFLPSTFGSLLLPSIGEQSVALAVSTLVPIDGLKYVVPVQTAEATADWVGEGADTLGDGPTYDELEVQPAKLARTIQISSELADDSSGTAQDAITASLGRALSLGLDAAVFGSKGISTIQPAGLEDLAGVTVVNAPAIWHDLDPFAEALIQLESLGVKITSFVAHPTDLAYLLKLKSNDSDSNQPLLGMDATRPGGRTAFGVELLSSQFVTPGHVWGLCKPYSLVVMNRVITLEASDQSQFSHDITEIKGTLRAAPAWPFPEAVAKIIVGGDAS